MVAALEARSVGYRHAGSSAWLFKDLSFSVEAGQTLVLLGRNGRGKTTLLKCLTGLLPPTVGTVHRVASIGYVPQQFAAPFAYSVFDVVLMGRVRHIGLFSTPTAADRAVAREALELIGLSAFAGRAIATLSGGERQLVLIARAVASQATILLLDEPTAALDFHNQAVVLAMLRRLGAERGFTIVMSTHEPTHALEIGDRVLLLQGDKSEEGPVASICTDDKLSEVYGLPMTRLSYRVGESEASSIVASYRDQR